MAGAKRIVGAFLAVGEACETTGLAQRSNSVTTTSQDLMWISLMADVPNQTIVRRVEDPMQGYGEFDDSEARTKMAAGHRHCIYHLFAEFGRDLRQLLFRQLTQIKRRLNTIE